MTQTCGGPVKLPPLEPLHQQFDRVRGFGFWVSDLGLLLIYFWFRVQGSEFRVEGSGFRF
jgi:hypothetical protein